ncbi:MAG: OmpP1/FadL family transporter [Bacteroidota bacterium]
MSIEIRSKVLSSALGLMAVLGTAGEAAASGFQLREQSSEGLGNAFAGATAKAYNLSTVFYNPAGMTRLEGNQVAGSATLIMPQAHFSGTNTLGATQTRGGDGGDAINDAAVGAVYGMWDARPDLKFGIAVTAPFGLRSDYEEDWVGRYHALGSSITNINVSPSVAYRVNQNLSVGAGLQVDYAKVSLSQALNMSALGLGADGKAVVEGDDIGFGGDVGVLYEFTPTTRVGLNYRSQIKHTLEGDAKFQLTPTQKAILTGAGQKVGDTGASADLTTPDTVSFGVYHEISPQWAVMSDVQWTNWSTFKEVRVKYDSGRADSVTDESWNDTWFFSLGATYTMDERNKFHFGVAYDQTPVNTEHRTARIPDTNRYWLSGGYTYDLDPNFQINVAYTHIFADKANINELNDSTNRGTLAGSYDASVDILSTSFVWKF